MSSLSKLTHNIDKLPRQHRQATYYIRYHSLKSYFFKSIRTYSKCDWIVKLQCLTEYRSNILHQKPVSFLNEAHDILWPDLDKYEYKNSLNVAVYIEPNRSEFYSHRNVKL